MKIILSFFFILFFYCAVFTQKFDLPVDYSYVINNCLYKIDCAPFEKNNQQQYFTIEFDSLPFEVTFIKNKFATIISDDFVWLNIHKKGNSYTIQTDNGDLNIYYKMNRKNQITSFIYQLDSQTSCKSKYSRFKQKWATVEKMNEDIIQKLVNSIYEIHFKVFN
jgi:hypothetical protein